MADLSQDEWFDGYKNSDQAIILDVRTEEEFEAGYIPNSINIDFYGGQAFLEELEKLDKSKDYYVYCRSGSRSAQTCALMGQLNFNKAYNLAGGITEWDGDIEVPE